MGSQRCVSRSASATILLSLPVIACGDDGGIPDGAFKDTDTTTGGTSDTEPEQADETGAGELQPVEGRCLYEPDPMGELYGLRYQCAGRVFLDVTIEHPFAGSPEEVPIELEFGEGVDGDSYQSPHVLACCPWYDPQATNCSQPHERACWVDFVEQGCKSMVGKIEAFAHATFPGVLHAAERNAVLKVADHVRDHQDQCTAAFREATGIAAMQPTCDEDGNGMQYGSMLGDGVWTFDPDGLVGKVEIAVAQADWYGLHPLADPRRWWRPMRRSPSTTSTCGYGSARQPSSTAQR